MTVLDLLARARQLVAASRPRAVAVLGWAWTHRTLVLAVAVVLLVALNARSCRRAATAEGQVVAAAARAEEEAGARRADVSPAGVVPQPVVDDEAKRILAAHPALLARAKALEAEVGRLRAVLAVRGKTDAVPAAGPVRPGEPPAGDSGAPPVLLRRGDGLRLTLDGVALAGAAGSVSLLLDVGAVRAADDVELGRAPLSVPLTTALLSELAPAASRPAAPGRRLRWGPAGGVAGSSGGGGWLAGLAGTYRVDPWGWRLDLFLAGGAGTGGAAALAGVLF